MIHKETFGGKDNDDILNRIMDWINSFNSNEIISVSHSITPEPGNSAWYYGSAIVVTKKAIRTVVILSYSSSLYKEKQNNMNTQRFTKEIDEDYSLLQIGTELIPGKLPEHSVIIEKAPSVSIINKVVTIEAFKRDTQINFENLLFTMEKEGWKNIIE